MLATKKRTSRFFTLGLLLLLASIALPSRADAAFVFTISQVGNDVVVSGSGSLNLADAAFSGTTPGSNIIIPNQALLTSGAGPDDRYTGLLGPAAFGTGMVALPTSSMGDLVGLQRGTVRFSYLLATARDHRSRRAAPTPIVHSPPWASPPASTPTPCPVLTP